MKIQSLLAGALIAGFTSQVPAAGPQTIFRVEADAGRARLTALGWDTEGGDRARVNLLRPKNGIELRIKSAGQWFQNGVVNAFPKGAEFYTWDGQTIGYEGHLTYSYSFLQAVLLREEGFREKLFRPL